MKQKAMKTSWVLKSFNIVYLYLLLLLCKLCMLPVVMSIIIIIIIDTDYS